jgi:hypothetical protein
MGAGDERAQDGDIAMTPLKDQIKMTTVHEGEHIPLMFAVAGILVAVVLFALLGF